MIVLGIVAVYAAVWLYFRRRARFTHLEVASRMERRPTGTLRSVHYPAKDGTRLEGWLFVPNGVERAPIVLMAPGLGGTKDGFLESFAWKFVESGVAVLAFDYRSFGGSDGLPRHHVDPLRHADDYEATLSFVRQSLGAEIDVSRIALWGSSFSGGTALVVAARDPDLAALVVQCPFLATPKHLEPRGWAMFRFVFLTMLDLSRVFPPIYVPLFGRPGEWVFAPSTENPSVHDFEGPLGSPFWRLLPKPPLGGWDNRMLARMLATFDRFEPLAHVANVRCPALFVAARDDDMVPVALVEQAAAGHAFRIFDCGHFDLYVGADYATNVAVQAKFLVEHLHATVAGRAGHHAEVS